MRHNKHQLFVFVMLTLDSDRSREDILDAGQSESWCVSDSFLLPVGRSVAETCVS